MSTFSTINTAYSALAAYQRALDVTGQNIANVSTPGYHRAEAVLSERATATPSGTLLGGVTVEGITRANTAYVDIQLGLAASESGRWSTAQSRLTTLQSVLSPSTGNDLGALLDSFWNSWQGLSASPDQLAPRLAVQQSGSRLAAGLRGQYGALSTLNETLYQDLGTTVQQVNDLAEQLAAVNANLSAIQAAGASTASLENTQQNLLEQLSELTGAVAVAPDAPGGPIVTVGRQPLVQGSQAFKLELSRGPAGEAQVSWASSGMTAEVQGQLGGLLQVREQQLPEYFDALNQIAGAVISSVNALHTTGAGMNGEVGDFFAGAGAADIRLTDSIAASPAAIAAGAAGLPGSNSVASAIADLQHSPILGGRTSSDAAAGLLAQIGNEVNQATDGAATADAVRQQMLAQQQSIAGVSLDEEMVKMIQYQDAYGAASRVLVTMNAMLDDLLSIIR